MPKKSGEKFKKAIQTAGDQTKTAVNKATDQVKTATNKAGNQIEAAVNKAVDVQLPHRLEEAYAELERAKTNVNNFGVTQALHDTRQDADAILKDMAAQVEIIKSTSQQAINTANELQKTFETLQANAASAGLKNNDEIHQQIAQFEADKMTGLRGAFKMLSISTQFVNDNLSKAQIQRDTISNAPKASATPAEVGKPVYSKEEAQKIADAALKELKALQEASLKKNGDISDACKFIQDQKASIEEGLRTLNAKVATLLSEQRAEHARAEQARQEQDRKLVEEMQVLQQQMETLNQRRQALNSGNMAPAAQSLQWTPAANASSSASINSTSVANVANASTEEAKRNTNVANV